MSISKELNLKINVHAKIKRKKKEVLKMNQKELERLMINSGGTYYDNRKGIMMSMHEISKLADKIKKIVLKRRD